jgi:hypothetical protein
VLIVLGTMWYAGVFEPEKAKPQAAVDCAWNPASGDKAKDVGRPPTNGPCRRPASRR